MSKSALATLTAQYTDSENEDERHEDESPDSGNSQASQVIIPKPTLSAKTSDNERASSADSKKRKRKKSVRRLVSYNDDIIISDEEDGQVTESTEESSSESEDEKATNHSDRPASNENVEKVTAVPMEVDAGPIDAVKEDKQLRAERLKKYAPYKFSLPPEPKGKPSPELVDKIRTLYEKMQTTNMDMNRVIQERKEFRNPSIYEKLIQFCDINEFGTNYPPEMYDPLQVYGPESYYEELARVQKEDMLKRQKERKENGKIEQATALARKVEEEAKKRKSKWDQPAPTVKPVALTTTVTGTKGTVISAFGSLPKKPAA